MQFLLDNFTTIAMAVLFILGIVLRERKRAAFEVLNETIFFAFDSAEQRGVLEGIPGIQKFSHYMKVWRGLYEEQFGRPPEEKEIAYAARKAGELAEKEKSVREMVEEMARPKLSEA